MIAIHEVDMDDSTLSEDQAELVGFFQKADSEGGLLDMLMWGGSEAFPPMVQPEARRFEEALLELEKALDEQCRANGLTP